MKSRKHRNDIVTDGWSLVYQGFDPAEEGLREALCTLGNGYFATRGAVPECDADDVHYPGTYLAGGYNRLRTDLVGRVVENEDLVNLPNWLVLKFRIEEDNGFNPMAGELLSYRQELDIRAGVLIRTVHFQDKHGRRTRFEQRRLVHMRDRHLAAMQTTLTPENWSGRIEFRSALDGTVVNAGVARYRNLNNKHLTPIETGQIDDETMYLKVMTNQSELRIAQVARTQVFKDGEIAAVARRLMEGPGYIGQEFSIEVAQGRPVMVEKVVGLHTSRDQAVSECGLAATKTVARAGAFAQLLKSHVLAWDHLWRGFEIELGEQNESQRMDQTLRLHIFHLLQTASPHTMDLDVGIPARGLHGEAYRGHVFWDELFIFPLLNLRIPEITRSLLKYRYNRLNEARAAAREAGYRGAMYPWQSGSDGREESQHVHLNPRSGRWAPDNTHLQRHINAAIAYNVWQYYQVTDDMEFLSYYGAEMILEIARFWASIAKYNKTHDRYEISGVMGPDEYHDAYPGARQPGLDNNAYTNVMAVWVLCCALKLVDILPADRQHELTEYLELLPEEFERWQVISRKMRIAFHDDGIISQFEGYHELEEFDRKAYRRKYENIQRLDRILEAEGDTPNRYKISKQADVLMLFYLFSSEELGSLFTRLGYPFRYDTIPKNIDYYTRRTCHGSTLGRVVHSWVLSRAGRPRSWQVFGEALKSDVADVQGGTTPEGIHLGAMAGTVDVVQRGYTGIETRGDVLWLNPRLPDGLSHLRLQIRYRAHSLEITVTPDRLTVRALGGIAKPIKVGYRGEVRRLEIGTSTTFPLLREAQCRSSVL